MGRCTPRADRVYHDEPPYFRGFAPWGHTLRRGFRAFAPIAVYLMPAILLAGATAALHCYARSALIWVTGPLALACFLIAIYALPGGMTYNAAFNDISYLYRPDKALRRALDGRSSYLRAWPSPSPPWHSLRLASSRSALASSTAACEAGVSSATLSRAPSSSTKAPPFARRFRNGWHDT
ncbi:hypothetical protein NAEX_08040 [Nannocystis exedens]|nr:hypothetical protein NAEX_08040 [Nannocystis exedens]